MTSTEHASRPAATPAVTPADAMSALLASNWWLIVLRGVAGIGFGLVALFFPAVTMLSLVLVFAAYLFVDGVFGVISGVRAARRNDRWGWLTFEGVLNIVVAVLAVAWPGLTVVAFVLMVAVWALLSGIFMVAAAFKLRIDHGRWWLVLGGLVSVIYGIALIIAPLIGALVLTWWIGAYAIVFGIALLILGFRLRSRGATTGAASV